MADRSYGEDHVSPVGTVLREPTFPNITAHPSNPGQGTERTLSKTNGPSPADVTREKDAAQPEQSTSLSQADTQQHTSGPVRPAKQRFATERPKPSVRHSLLGRKRSGPHTNKATQLNKSTTLTFDPYSSESDSADSSDEETCYPHNSLGHEDGLARQESRKRRDASGPFSRLKVANEHFKTHAKVSRADGRLKLSILEKDLDSGYIAKALGAVLKKHPKDGDDSVRTYDTRGPDAAKIAPEDDEMEHNPARRIKLNIVIIIIGSRGDIQPFIRIGKILKEDYGHRVRLATHPAFKDFVEKDSGLEFFSVGGNPAELMAFMVKNPGLIPNIDTIKDGEIGRRRAQMYEMFQGMWRACINATDDETDKANAKMMGDKQPFVADAIIANPPSFAAPHIAEKLGIPLHMMFTFPYTPTVQFPHPLANIKTSNVEAPYSNFMSYPLVEMMTWQGLGDLINRFRTEVLLLEVVSTLWAPGQLYRLKVPYTYMWSPALVPKPKDWGPEIDISGFVFLDLATNFTPPDDLKAFLDGGEPPVYIGFGSIVVDDPDGFTKLIFEGVRIAGCRALVSKGWGGFGSNADCPDNVFMIDNTPHDWLFPRCSAVVHHGGAGTTAIGLKCAKPTMIVPFFGDQPFWGAMVSKAKAGAHECIPFKNLNAERLAEGIKQCLTEEARENVKKIADSIVREGDGALNAVRSFHRSLPLRGEGSMRCDFLYDRAAAWKIRNTDVKLSALAAEILVEKKKLKWSELRLIRHYEWNDFGGPGEPLTGAWGSMVKTLVDAASGVGGVPVEMGKSIRKREKIREKKRRIRKRNEHKTTTLSKANGDATDDMANKQHDQNGRPKPEREESTLSKISEPDEDLAQELGHEAVFGFRKTGRAIVRFPMQLTLALQQGFHNAPRLYGDETVRRPPRVTGVHSGLRAGRDELLHGVRDGVTGIVMQPYHGAKDNGVVGALRGIGFGVGGFVLKDIAALLGPLAYSMKGLDAEYWKRYQPTVYLRRARIMQGQVELQKLESESRAARMDGAKGGGGSVVDKRDEAERNVSTKWQALQRTIEDGNTHHKSGVMASLLGQGKTKEGQRVPRKSSEKEGRRSQSKARTTPIAQADEPMKAVIANGGLKRSSTAPIMTMEQGAKNGLKDIEAPRAPCELQSSKPAAPENPQLPDIPRNNSDPELTDASNDHAGAKDRPSALIAEANKTQRHSTDASSDKTRVGSDATDWAAVRQKAEGLENRGQALEVSV
ncbi:glycosyltransferase family 1 protein [Cucurbitaria berberidis CBS 394.84]|uniref:Glycosyltransferase family 1 protein n=1 Tax=Cucurbitaria berberidis CBS 394.84 TaxID=1168544 RepID=A0A9P4GCQ0_9PLEO|nr:glycosyltransferase family 1 protein [Cucurbitaria berberidis CBS 394.84]KAF1843089.1 glycosyltransferase family 1 protein [Cucurbitaria berberidis CBS 394.84]